MPSHQFCFHDVSEGGLKGPESHLAVCCSCVPTRWRPWAPCRPAGAMGIPGFSWRLAVRGQVASSWELPHLSSQLLTSVRKRLCSSTSQQRRPHASQVSRRRSNKSNVNTWYMTSFWTWKQYISIKDNLGNTLTIQRRKELSDLITTPRWKPLLPFW